MPSPHFSIRPARLEDAAAVAALLGELGYASSAGQTASRLARMKEDPHSPVFVAEAGETVGGVLSLHCIPLLHEDGKLGRITALVVAAQFRRCGLGAQLVRTAEEYAVHHGCTRFEVTSGDHRPEAHTFYQNLGYEVNCRRFIRTPDAPGAF